jgi:hypothetical protein
MFGNVFIDVWELVYVILVLNLFTRCSINLTRERVKEVSRVCTQD